MTTTPTPQPDPLRSVLDALDDVLHTARTMTEQAEAACPKYNGTERRDVRPTH